MFFIIIALLVPSLFAKHIALVSFHGTKTNGTVLRYDLPSGKFQGSFLSVGQEEKYRHPRGIMWLQESNELLLLEASTKGEMLKFNSTDCGAHGKISQSYEDTTLMNHPFGIAISKDEYFISQQDGGSVIRVKTDLKSGKLLSDKVKDPRGLTIGPDGKLYVASATDVIFVVDLSSGSVVNSLKADKPIDVITYKHLILYGVRGTKGDSSFIIAYEPSKSRVVFNMTDSHLNHPAGMAVVGDILYVLSQTNMKLLSFDLVKQKFNGVIVDSLPDYPEGLTIVFC